MPWLDPVIGARARFKSNSDSLKKASSNRRKKQGDSLAQPFLTRSRGDFDSWPARQLVL